MLGTQDRAQHIGFQGVHDAQLGQFVDPRLEPHGTRIVDQGRDRSQLLVDFDKQADDFFFVADIGTHRDGLGAQGTYLRQYLMGRGIIGQVIDADPIPLLRRQ